MTKVVYNLEDLGKYVDKIYYKKIGVWSIGNHGEIHDGHRKCYEEVKKNSDFIIGLIVNTWMLQIAQISKKQKKVVILPISSKAIKEAKSLCDIVMIYDKDYTSFDDPKQLRQQAEYELPDNQLPKFIQENDDMLDSLRAAQAFKIVMNPLVMYSYHCGSLKDPWRFYYSKWHNQKWLFRFYDLIKPVTDEYGQSLSDSYPKSLQEKINKPLLLKGMRKIEDLEKNVKSIKGLKVLFFGYDSNTKYILARFYHDEFPNKWWNISLEDS
jgi:hypothetical protein